MAQAPRFGPPFADSPRLLGHRGAATLAPENTLAAIRAAAAAGLRWIEIDAKLAADGVPVLMHDKTLDRTTTATGPAAARPSTELTGLDAGSWFGADGPDAGRFAGETVPTLAQCLGLCRDLGLSLNIEVKPDDGAEESTAAAVLETLDAEGWTADDGVLISSFKPAAVRVVRDVAPDYRRGLLIWEFPQGWREAATDLGVQAVLPNQLSLQSAEHVAQVIDGGWVPMTFTVNDADRARQLYDWGVVGIVTDDPLALKGL